MKIRTGLWAFALCAMSLALCASPRPASALPGYAEVRRAYLESESFLLDRRGEVIHELRTDRQGRRLEWVSLENISPALREAVIAAEDKRFFDHSGVDYRALGAALLRVFSPGGPRGASTISMQLAALLDQDLRAGKGRRSVRQKFEQVRASRDLEGKWSKEEILEAYLNLIPFRGELRGIAAASRGIFGKDPHGLDRAESLLLACLIRSPGASSHDLTRRALQLAEVLNWPARAWEIDAAVKQAVLGPHLPRPRTALAPHAARQLLKGRPGGTSIPCTLDAELQRFVLDRLDHHLLSLRPQNVRDGAVLVVENRRGEVLAYASRSGEPSLTGYVDGVRARRQAGSTLKPFLYGLALEERILTPASLLEDSPLDVPVPRGLYHPRNYESRFQGLVPVRTALASSLNVPAVRALLLVGPEAFLSALRALGIQNLDEAEDFYGPALALGSADVSLWELVGAYRALAGGGEWGPLGLLPAGESPPAKERVFSPEAAFVVSDILSDREARSLTFGLENPLATRFWTAVKTGTSKDMRDNWCLGYSSKYTVGVWVGNFSGEAMWNVSGISGASPVWVEVMNRLHRDETQAQRRPPAGLVKARVEFPQGAEPARDEWFLRGTEPALSAGTNGEDRQRILYPPAGTVLALDPDIPPDSQRIFFILQTPRKEITWVLNGEPIPSSGKATPWLPRPGLFRLALTDAEGRVLDSVHFTVKGSSAGGEDEEGWAKARTLAPKPGPKTAGAEGRFSPVR